MKVLLIVVLISTLWTIGSLSAYSQMEIPKDLTISLDRSMCFGWCPAYIVTISADGVVNFTPKGEFAHRGDGPMPALPLTSRIMPEQIKDLLAEFQMIKFFSLRRNYGSIRRSKRTPSCPEYSTDSPSATLTLVWNRRRKTVDHYLGCSGTNTLEQLRALEDKVDVTANTEQWTSQFGWGVGSVADLLLSADEMDDLVSNRQIRVTTKAADPENDVLTYQYIVSGGKIIGTGPEVIWDLSNTPPGTYTITAGVDDGCGICGKTMTKTVSIK